MPHLGWESYQDEQLGIVLVGERGERDGAELATLQPMDSGGVDGHSLLRGNVRPVLQIVVLPFLLSFQVQPCEPGQDTACHNYDDVRRGQRK